MLSFLFRLLQIAVCCKSETKSLILWLDLSRYASVGTHTQLRVASSEVSESQLVSDWQVALFLWLPQELFGNLNEKRKEFFPPKPSISVLFHKLF